MKNQEHGIREGLELRFLKVKHMLNMAWKLICGWIGLYESAILLKHLLAPG